MTSYGLRCGAAIVLGQEKEAVQQVKIVFEKDARATWSNINNGAMATFVDVLDNHKDAYDKEKIALCKFIKRTWRYLCQRSEGSGIKTLSLQRSDSS